MRKNRGFTLIEMIVTVAIIGILAAVAWPMFESQQVKSRRSDAVIALTSARQALIAYRSDNGSYPPSIAATESALMSYRPNAPDSPPMDCKSGRGYQANLNTCNNYYTLSATQANGNSFTLQATPRGNFSDTDCGALTLDHLGTRGRTGTDPVKRCWAE